MSHEPRGERMRMESICTCITVLHYLLHMVNEPCKPHVRTITIAITINRTITITLTLTLLNINYLLSIYSLPSNTPCPALSRVLFPLSDPVLSCPIMYVVAYCMSH